MKIAALLISMIAALAPGEAPEYAPAGDEALAVDLKLDGYVNGAMSSDRLMTSRGCTLERDAAYTFALMMDAAEKDGVRLVAGDCYRSFGRQTSAYNSRCPVIAVAVYDTDPVTGEQWQTGSRSQRVCSGPPTARPGHSNHGWGRAVDFTDGGGVLTCNDRALLWLQGNAHRFGWVHPRWAWCDRSSAEPWHWEYAGVTSPSLVGYTQLDENLIQLIE